MPWQNFSQALFNFSKVILRVRVNSRREAEQVVVRQNVNPFVWVGLEDSAPCSVGSPHEMQGGDWYSSERAHSANCVHGLAYCHGFFRYISASGPGIVAIRQHATGKDVLLEMGENL